MRALESLLLSDSLIWICVQNLQPYHQTGERRIRGTACIVCLSSPPPQTATKQCALSPLTLCSFRAPHVSPLDGVYPGAEPCGTLVKDSWATHSPPRSLHKKRRPESPASHLLAGRSEQKTTHSCHRFSTNPIPSGKLCQLKFLTCQRSIDAQPRS